MRKNPETPPLPDGQFLVYQTADGKLKIDVRFEGETVWLSQQHMAELFQTSKQNVGQHLKSTFSEGELVQGSVVKDSFTTAADGKNCATRFYNVDAIISVGYRVKSAVATQEAEATQTMNLNESVVEAAALEWFGELGCAVVPAPQLSPGRQSVQYWREARACGQSLTDIRKSLPFATCLPPPTTRKSCVWRAAPRGLQRAKSPRLAFTGRH